MELSRQVLLAPIVYFPRHKTYIKICHLDLSNSNLMSSDSQYRKTTFLLNSVQSWKLYRREDSCGLCWERLDCWHVVCGYFLNYFRLELSRWQGRFLFATGNLTKSRKSGRVLILDTGHKTLSLFGCRPVAKSVVKWKCPESCLWRKKHDWIWWEGSSFAGFVDYLTCVILTFI